MRDWFWYLLMINSITSLAYGLDKWESRRNGRRISEGALIGLATLGGAVGGLLAMYAFHHKTRKILFRWGLPLLLMFQLGAVLYFWRF